MKGWTVRTEKWQATDWAIGDYLLATKPSYAFNLPRYITDGYWLLPTTWAKRPTREAVHSPLTSGRVMHVRNHASISTCVCGVTLIMHVNKLTFIYMQSSKAWREAWILAEWKNSLTIRGGYNLFLSSLKVALQKSQVILLESKISG
jgi:hypothetical protein